MNRGEYLEPAVCLSDIHKPSPKQTRGHKMSNTQFTRDLRLETNAERSRNSYVGLDVYDEIPDPFFVKPTNAKPPPGNRPETKPPVLMEPKPKPCCRGPPLSWCILTVVLTLIIGILLGIVLTGRSLVLKYNVISVQIKSTVTNMLNYRDQWL